MSLRTRSTTRRGESLYIVPRRCRDARVSKVASMVCASALFQPVFRRAAVVGVDARSGCSLAERMRCGNGRSLMVESAQILR